MGAANCVWKKKYTNTLKISLNLHLFADYGHDDVVQRELEEQNGVWYGSYSLESSQFGGTINGEKFISAIVFSRRTFFLDLRIKISLVKTYNLKAIISITAEHNP